MGLIWLSKLVLTMSLFEHTCTSLHNLVNILEGQLAMLQSKQVKDEQDITDAVAILAARITSLGG